MRRIGKVDTEQLAERFDRYLASQQIESQVDRGDDGWTIWIYDEELLDKARAELVEFQSDPDAARFQVKAAPRPEKTSPPSSVRRRQKRQRTGVWAAPVTVVLLTACLIVTGITDFGKAHEDLVQILSIAEYQLLDTPAGQWIEWRKNLAEVRHGELWRLFTPMLLHLSVLHIVFNTIAIWILGSLIERAWSPLRLVWLVLIIAPIAHIVQFYVGGPQFGGISGVVYGLFGYLWINSTFSPNARVMMHPAVVMQMLIWLFLGLAGLLGPIANGAHFGGLLAGMLLAGIGILWQRSRLQLNAS